MIPPLEPRPASTSTAVAWDESDYVKQYNERLWPLLDNTRFAISRLREIELNQFGLTIEQSSILKIIVSLGGSSNIGELEFLTLRQSHTLSTLINRMNRLALVGKKRSQTEKRNTIYITEKGKNLLTWVTENSLTEVFSCLTEKQMEQFIYLFSILRTKALDLLRVPFLKYIIRDKPGVYEPWRMISPEASWTIFDGTRFVIARLREIEIAQFGLTLEQFVVLKTISENQGAMTTKNLEEATLRQHHSISVLINRMIKLGTLTKTRKTGENRNTITITPKGWKLLQTITNLSIELTFSALKSREKEQMARYLRLLHDKARLMLGKTNYSDQWA
jgi:DNA-binding MarR family transcriptional regulator